MKGDLQKLISQYGNGKHTIPLPVRILKAKQWLDKQLIKQKVELAKDYRHQNNPETFKRQNITPLTALKQLIDDLENELKKKG
jgi:hypothetical protein